MAELGVWFIVAIVAGILLFVILPLICCCIFCGWCCSCCCGPRRQKPGAVHIHQQPQALAPTTIVQSNTSVNQYSPPQHQSIHPHYNPNHNKFPQSGFDSNVNVNPYYVDEVHHNQRPYSRGGLQQSQHYYYDQRYKPLTEFGLSRNQYPNVESHAPRNYLGQSHYDIYDKATRNDPRGAKYGPGLQRQARY